MQVQELISEIFPGSDGKLISAASTSRRSRRSSALRSSSTTSLSCCANGSYCAPLIPSRFDIHYSVKANPNLNLLRFFWRRERDWRWPLPVNFIWRWRQVVPRSRILFAGPGKTPAEIEVALKVGMGEIHAESLVELERIASIAERLNQIASVAIRVNPNSEPKAAPCAWAAKAAPSELMKRSCRTP